MSERLDRLLVLRLKQEEALAGPVPLRELSPLSREYRATLVEISELDTAKADADGIDEIAKRRAARRPGTGKGAARAK